MPDCVDFVVIKYDSNGKQVWVRRYDRSETTDFPTGIVLDNTGDLYVVGRVYPVSKYSNDGKLPWTSSFSGAGAATRRMAR